MSTSHRASASTGFLRRLPPPTDVRIGWLVWAGAFVGVCVVLAMTGHDRGVTDVYEGAARHWLAHDALYGPGWTGFLYAPPSALVYIPFLFPAPLLGSYLWRLAGLALLASGLFRLAQHAEAGGARRHFALLTWLVLPVTLSSLRNGQSNLHLAGVLVHAAVALGQSRPRPAAGWLCLGWLFKPIVVVPMLLAGARDRRMLLPLLVGTGLVFALPFLTAPPSYVVSQYEAFGPKLTSAGDPEEAAYTNVEGIARVLGHPIPRPLRRPLQAAAAFAALVLLLRLQRATSVREQGALLVTLATVYLMLFNPRTEPNSYVLLVPWVAWPAARAWTGGCRRLALFYAFVCLGLASDNYGLGFHALTSKWWKPTLTMLFLLVWLRRAHRPAQGGVRA